MGRQPRDRQAGSAVAELVVITPVLVLVAMVFVALGRFENAKGLVSQSARAAAQAAVVQATSPSADASATSAGLSELSQGGLSCVNPNVSTDLSNFHPGGWVSVTVTCTASTQQLTLPGMPGSKTLVETATAPVEFYRVVNP